MVEGQKVVKVFNYEPKAIARFNVLSDNLRKAGTAAMTYGGLMGPMMNNFSHMQYAVVAITAAAFMIISMPGARSVTARNMSSALRISTVSTKGSRGSAVLPDTSVTFAPRLAAILAIA